VTIVSVYVVDKNNETAWLRGQGPGRDLAMFSVDAVYPDHRIANVYLSVERPTARISNKSTLLESEDVHEELLGSLHVLIHSQWDNRLGSHATTVLPHFSARVIFSKPRGIRTL